MIAAMDTHPRPRSRTGRPFGAALAAALLGAGCAAAGPTSARLEYVAMITGVHATCGAVTAALKSGDLGSLHGLVMPDYREGGIGAPRAAAEGPHGLAVVRFEATGADCFRAGLATRRARYQRVDGGLFKVRQVLEATADTLHARCEQRVRGVLADGRREEEVRWLDVTFRRDGGTWRFASCAEERREAVVAATPLFADGTEASGVRHTYQEHLPYPADPLYPGEHEGGGVTAVDADGDGDTDLFLADGRQPALWLNRGDGTFVDGSAAAGFQPNPEGSTRATLCVDFDGDGVRDLFVTVYHGPNRYYRGLGGGRYAEATAAAGLTDSGQFSTAAAAADVDGDGDLDLFVANYGDARHVPVDFAARNGEADRLFRNRGDGTFEDVTAAAGLAHTGFGLACTFADVDRDGDADLYVADDFSFNAFFRNRGDGTFEDVSAATRANDVGMGMGITFADLDGDGDLDGYISNMFSSVGQWIFDDPDYPTPGLGGFFFRGRVLDVMHKLAAGNSVLRNDGDAFTDVSAHSGAANGGWAWSAPALDADADGRQDLFVSAGFITGPTPEDT